MAAGSIIIDLLMRTGSFETDTKRAEKSLEGLKRQVETIGASIGGLLVSGATAAAAAFSHLAKEAGEFKDLEEQTGETAENLASLSIAAAVAGVSVADVAGQMNRLTKNLTGVDDESKAAGAALSALGIPLEDFKRLSPAEQIDKLSEAFNGFADGSQKTAVALALFGKQGAQMLNLFKELDAEGGRRVILTQQQIEQADDYADKQAKLNATIREYARAAATDVVPALNELSSAAKEIVAEFAGIDDAGKKLAGDSPVKEFAEGVVSALAFVIDAGQGVARVFQTIGKTIGAESAALSALASGELKQAKNIIAEAQEDIDRLLNAELFSQRIARLRQEALKAASGDPNQSAAETKRLGRKPQLEFNGTVKNAGASKVDQELKKQLDGRIKEIERFAVEQRDAYAFANTYVDGVLSDGLISLEEHYATETRVREAGVQAQVQALDKEIAALEAYKAKVSGAERIETENKIADAVRKRADVTQKAGRDNILAVQQEARAAEQLRNRYDDLRASVLQLQGDTAGAARIRIDQQVSEARKLITQAGGDPAQAEQLRAGLEGQQALNEAQKEYARLVDQSRNAEESLMLSAQESGASEFDTLKAVGEQRQKALAQLQAMVDKANELALRLGTPEAIQFAEQLGLQFKKAAAEVDPLLGKLRDVGKQMGESIAGNFEDAIVAGKSLGDVLKSIEQDLLRIVARNLITKPLGDSLSNLLGGNGQASGGGGLIGSIGSSIGSLFSGFFADGGTIPAGQWGVVGERGPEPAFGGSTGLTVRPTGSDSGMVVNQHFSFAQPPSRETQLQVGARAAAGLQRAQRNL